MEPSNHLLALPDALRKRVAAEGYAFFRNVLPAEPVLDLRRQMLRICAEAGWIAGGARLDDAVPVRAPVNEGEAAYFEVYDRIQQLEAFHSLAHHPDVTRVMKTLLGPQGFPHPLGIARLMFPGNNECATPPHQDYPNNQGTPDLYACWIPLGDCPVDLGGLAILERSHERGVLPLTFSLGPGGRQTVLDEELASHRWLTADFRAGDALVFHSLTVHRSLNNQYRDRMRLSCDFRFQREGEELVARSLLPHFARLDWDQIYASWTGPTPRRYWEALDYRVVPWDNTYHALPEEHLGEAVRLKRAYDTRRLAPAGT
jgi:ectoine hydroxylase-related dioxygenase (phytanoyl-CoA dioxygenase family)